MRNVQTEMDELRSIESTVDSKAEVVRPSSTHGDSFSMSALSVVLIGPEDLRRQKKITGKLLVFVGAKGGSGVTTLTSNFAMALAAQGAGKVALLDLDLQLGDAALTLGLKAKFSLMDAMESAHRMDSDLL